MIEIPKKCGDCKHRGDYTTGPYARNPHHCCELIWQLFREDYRVLPDTLDSNCPLKNKALIRFMESWRPEEEPEEECTSKMVGAEEQERIMRDQEEEECGECPQEKPEPEETKYPQDEEPNEYRYIDPAWIDAVAEGLTAGAKKHPKETWKDIPPEEHAARAIRHLFLFRKGDRTEDHLINASMRCMMASVLAREAKTEKDALKAIMTVAMKMAEEVFEKAEAAED